MELLYLAKNITIRPSYQMQVLIVQPEEFFLQEVLASPEALPDEKGPVQGGIYYTKVPINCGIGLADHKNIKPRSHGDALSTTRACLLLN